jgi:invasion protein IalB
VTRETILNIAAKSVLTIALAIVPLMAFPATAGAAGLPGGATSLNESHGDWALRCGERGAAGDATTLCSVTQTQIDKNTKRRVLAIALNPQKGGGIKGIVMMPFGLLLDNGATFQLDDGAATSPTHFRTCVPAGCILPIDWPDSTVKAMRSAKTLKISAVMDNGKPAPFSISMNGFDGAMDRAAELTGVK